MSYVLRYVSNEGHVYKLNCWITQISKNASNSPADTFISILPTVVEDLSGNPAIPIPSTNAVGTSVVMVIRVHLQLHPSHLIWTMELSSSTSLAKKRMGNHSNCMLNTLPVLEDIHYCLLACKLSICGASISLLCW